MAVTDTEELRPFYTIDGLRVNHKRVERIWREEGLKVPKKQPKRKRLWLQRVRAFGYVRIVAIFMELSPSGRLYLRWKAYSNADSSWTSLLGSAWRSMSPSGSPARMCSSGSSDLFVHRACWREDFVWLTIGSAATSLSLGEFGEGLRRENSLVQEWFGEIYATSILA